MDAKQLKRRIRNYILFFMAVIIFNGVILFPVESVLGWIVNHISGFPGFMHHWLIDVHNGIKETNDSFPFLGYGADWLAWCHLIIAVLLLGPLVDPVKNIWIIRWAMISCIMALPLALIAGPLREVPFFWQLIDCSLAMLGLILLSFCLKDIRKLEVLSNQ